MAAGVVEEAAEVGEAAELQDRREVLPSSDRDQANREILTAVAMLPETLEVTDDHQATAAVMRIFPRASHRMAGHRERLPTNRRLTAQERTSRAVSS